VKSFCFAEVLAKMFVSANVFVFSKPPASTSVSDLYPQWIRIQLTPGSGSAFRIGGVKSSEMKGKNEAKDSSKIVHHKKKCFDLDPDLCPH
jgi:hypothetical protein